MMKIITEEEIRRQIQNSNKCCYELSSIVPHGCSPVKLSPHRTSVRPVLIYGYETWTLIKPDELILGTSESKI
jgi:hypothetical protein